MTPEQVNEESPTTFSPNTIAPESAVDGATHSLTTALAMPVQAAASSETDEPAAREAPVSSDEAAEASASEAPVSSGDVEAPASEAPISSGEATEAAASEESVSSGEATEAAASEASISSGEATEASASEDASEEPAQESSTREPALDLLVCHEELRAFLSLSSRLAAGQEPPDSVSASAAAIYDYLMITLPIHMADEDYAIAPKLRTAGAPDVVQQALEVIGHQHSDLQAMIGRMASTWRTLAEQPERLPELASRLASGTARLSAVLEAHLALEEELLVPALGLHLPPETRALIAQELRLRPGAQER